MMVRWSGECQVNVRWISFWAWRGRETCSYLFLVDTNIEQWTLFFNNEWKIKCLHVNSKCHTVLDTCCYTKRGGVIYEYKRSILKLNFLILLNLLGLNEARIFKSEHESANERITLLERQTYLPSSVWRHTYLSTFLSSLPQSTRGNFYTRKIHLCLSVKSCFMLCHFIISDLNAPETV